MIYKIPATIDSLPEGIPPVVRPPSPRRCFRAATRGRPPAIAAPRLPKATASTATSSSSYALDKAFEMPEGLDKTGLLKAIEPHTIAVAELMGTYQGKGGF